MTDFPCQQNIKALELLIHCHLQYLWPLFTLTSGVEIYFSVWISSNLPLLNVVKLFMLNSPVKAILGLFVKFLSLFLTFNEYIRTF